MLPRVLSGAGMEDTPLPKNLPKFSTPLKIPILVTFKILNYF